MLQAVVSYRSVPRILGILNDRNVLGLNWIPHFTSVINWTLLVGLGLLNQVKAISSPWLAIVDHTIDIGTKKALVVLRVKLDTLSNKGSAIQLADCECIGLKLCETVNGETIAADLREIFKQAGNPKAIISDCDASLQKGIRLWSDQQEQTIPAIADIGHVMANALKQEFEKTESYQRFIQLSTQGGHRLRQTEWAFLIPPKLRSKGRFQSISNIGQWAENMLGVLAVKGGAKKGSLLAKLRQAMPGFLSLQPFIRRFASTIQIVAQVMSIVKNKGLDENSYKACYQLSETLPKKSKVKKRLQHWLEKHIAIQKQITTLPLLVSSDIIESLFGNFKHIMARSPQADMNRAALLIPTLCGNQDHATIMQALTQVRHKDLAQWEQENVPYTIRRKRRAFFANLKSQKTGNG